MSYRKERVANVVRGVVCDAIANHLSDPRIHRFTSVTRVEMTADLLFADVHVSVMGDDADGRTTVQGLNSARGVIQGRLARELNMRQCPRLRFQLDRGLKLATETMRKLDEVLGRSAGIDSAPSNPQPAPSDGRDRPVLGGPTDHANGEQA